ncbi:GntR family transcriptional regulator [Streptomyces sp. NPDC002073]
MSSGEGWVSTSVPYVKPQAAGSPDAWSQEAAAKGGKGTQRIVHAGEQAVPADVGHLLGLPSGAPAVVRRRVIELDGEPVELTDTYYPAHIAAGTPLAGTAKIRGGAVTLLASLGHTAARIVEEVTALLPSSEQCDQLRIAGDEPVLRISRATFDAEGHPFQADVMFMPAHRQSLRYEMTIG